jgi:MIP family channel proteins
MEMDDRNLRAYMAEMVGTFALVFVSAGAVFANQLSTPPWGTVAVGLAAGFIYAASLAVTLPISGGYLNPAVTMMLWVFKRLDGFKAFGFLLVQVLGAALAGLVLYFVLPTPEPARLTSRLGTPHLNLEAFGVGGVSLGTLLQGIAIELVLTFCLVFAIFGTVLDPRAPLWFGSRGRQLAALWIGLVLVAVTLVGFHLTGAAVNPARWLGPAMWDRIIQPDAFADHAVYWVGPIAGALIGGWLYTALLLPPEEEKRAAAPASGNAAGATAHTGSTLARSKR